jgi:hypothetical protein
VDGPGVGGEVEVTTEGGPDDIEGDAVAVEEHATRLTVRTRQLRRRQRSMRFLRINSSP